MAVKVKAEHLKDGDEIVLPNGTKATVRSAVTSERTIPKRKVKHSHISLEVVSKEGNTVLVGTNDWFAPANHKVDVISRNGFAWKRDQFLAKHKAYVNVFAAVCTGVVLTTILQATDIVTPLTAGSMLLLTFAMGVGLTVYTYLNAR